MDTNKIIPLIEKFHSMKIFSLDNNFEISFEKQLLIPYAGVDVLDDEASEHSGSALYMILQADRLEITNININNDPPIIEYRNCTSNQTHQIDNLWFFPFPIPRDALHIKILSETLVEIGIKEAWRLCSPQLQEFEPTKLSIYDLVTQSKRTSETILEFDLLYIGSSKSIHPRLINHKTILRIYRDMALFRSRKELFVWILKPKSSFYKPYSGEFLNACSSSVRSKDKMFGIDVDDEQLLAISEAMLINYFKPKYNDHYKSKSPSYSHVVYAKLLDAGVKHLQVNLNLFMQVCKDILSINTESKNTENTKHLSLYCKLDDLLNKQEDNVLSVEILPEELYDLFIGNQE